MSPLPGVAAARLFSCSTGLFSGSIICAARIIVLHQKTSTAQEFDSMTSESDKISQIDQQPEDLQVLFNGTCPICSREIAVYGRTSAKLGRAIRFLDITTTAAAPSLIIEALPAVPRPPFLKAPPILDRAS